MKKDTQEYRDSLIQILRVKDRIQYRETAGRPSMSSFLVQLSWNKSTRGRNAETRESYHENVSSPKTYTKRLTYFVEQK